MKTNPQEIKTPSKQQLADVTLWVKSYTKPLLHFAMGKLASKETAQIPIILNHWCLVKRIYRITSV